MSRKTIEILFLPLFFFLLPMPGWALSGQGIADLKKAGVSDKTIQLMVEEKVLETAAFSVEDIVELKKAGVSEQTLRMLIKEGSFVKNAKPVVYGRATRSLRFTSVRDVIELKKAGLSDEVIQSVIAASSQRDDPQQEEAYELLRDMDVRIDLRGGR
jgi:hypothetical protein